MTSKLDDTDYSAGEQSADDPYPRLQREDSENAELNPLIARRP